MAEPRDPAELPEVPQALAEQPRRASLQLVWLIPIVAALIGGWLAVRAVLERGPVITISFTSAEGLEPGKTKVKYKNVDIGQLTSVALSENRAQVIAAVELTRQAEEFLVEDTRFWIVRPRISAGQVSGLGTLFSGSYIGVDVGKSTKSRRVFDGLDSAPIVSIDLPGRNFDLRAQDLGSLDVGSPVYLRRVQVGQVVAYELEPDGKSVRVKIFVNAAHDRNVNANTRFWKASGFDVALDASGVRVDTQSLATLLFGGVSFETPQEPGTSPAPADKAVFTLFADRDQAMRHPDTSEETYVLAFEESVRGLHPGAPVDFRGVVVGEVTAVLLDTDPATNEVRVPVEVKLYPERLRTRYRRDAVPGEPRHQALVDRLVERGLRAQLRTGSLLTGQLYVALDFFAKAPRAKLDWKRNPVAFPTAPSTIEELQGALTAIARQLEKVPFDALGADLQRSLKQLDATAQTLDRSLASADKVIKRLDTEIAPEARAALAELRRTLAAAERTLGNADRTLGSDAPVQHELRDALREVTRAAESMRALADYLERHPEAILRGRRQETE